MYKNLGERITESFQEDEEEYYSTDFESDDDTVNGKVPKTIQDLERKRKPLSLGLAGLLL